MKFPHNKSCANAVGVFLHKQSGATLEQIYAEFASREKRKVRETLSYMKFEGMISLNDGTYKVRPYLATHYDQCANQNNVKPVRELVPPRHVNLFTPPMTGYKLNVHGTRPEALEIMSARSKHL